MKDVLVVVEVAHELTARLTFIPDAKREYTPRHHILILGGNGYTRVETMGVGIETDLNETPYDVTQGSIATIDDLLKPNEITGLAVVSKAVLDHLQQTGRFEFNQRTQQPERYVRGSRIYKVY